MFVQDYILDGQGHGEVGSGLSEVRYDAGLLRPYLDHRGRPCVTMNTGRRVYDQKRRVYVPERRAVLIKDLHRMGIESPVHNATTLRKEEWIQIDRAVVRAARKRLRAWEDLSASSSFGGFDGMSKLTLEYEAMTDPGEALVDMEGIADGRTDAPLFKLRSIPLPITHSDFWFSQRRIAVSRNTGTPIDTTMAEAAGRRVAEMIEKTLIGVETGITYGTQTAGPGAHDGTSTVYGYTNFPYRITKTDLHTPAATNPEYITEDVIEMRELLYAQGFYGPFMVYYSTGYDRFFDDDYFRAGGTAATRTVRERVGAIEGVMGFRRLDYLTSGYQMIMVQMTPDVAQAINAMDITTVQWDSQGGLRRNFKVMAIQVPLLRAPYSGVAPIVHGTTS